MRFEVINKYTYSARVVGYIQPCNDLEKLLNDYENFDKLICFGIGSDPHGLNHRR